VVRWLIFRPDTCLPGELSSGRSRDAYFGGPRLEGGTGPSASCEDYAGELVFSLLVATIGRTARLPSKASLMKLSIIIPVLNERHYLPAMFAALTNLGAYEVIVVDGGSTDGSREYLNQQRNALVIDGERGRGTQLTAGAQIATGDVLVFLHCDCLLPPDGPKRIAQALASDAIVGGCFLVRFVEQYPRSLRLVAWGINGRTRFTHTATGDQAIFVRRSVYEAVGGFAAWPLFEDVDLVARIKRRGRFVVLSTAVTISARRWMTNGVWRTTLLMYALRAGYYAGISPFRLKRWFKDIPTPRNVPEVAENSVGNYTTSP
jgi:rSAM/selenodomain-associated transferase 2